jgi:hypothetical protein
MPRGGKSGRGEGSYLGRSTTVFPEGINSLNSTESEIKRKDTFLDIPSSGLQLYLDASNKLSYPGTGNIWYDLSSNKKDFTWASSPTYNSTGIRYFNTLANSANGPASNSFNINNTSGYTIFFTAYQNSLANTGSFEWSTTLPYNRGIFAHATWGDGNIYWDQGGCCGSDTRTWTPLVPSTLSWNVIALRNNYAATNRTIWNNNSIIATNTDPISNIDLSSGISRIGSSSYGGDSSTWNARIGQFVMYNRSLSDTEMTQVHNRLKFKVTA